MARWHLACDACDASACVGPAPDRLQTWCEACQSGHDLPLDPGGEVLCPDCGSRLSTDRLRFADFAAELRRLAAVLTAWLGDARLLEGLVPDCQRFLTDLRPPDSYDGDPPEVRAALEALRGGRTGEARRRLEVLAAGARAEDHARLWRALAIAAECSGDLNLAEICFSRALEGTSDEATSGAIERLHLARGALRARRGDLEGARADLQRAGDAREARWNRAALALVETVAVTPGLPGEEIVAEARFAAGPAGPGHGALTVGRLLWTLLVERAEERGRAGATPDPDERALRVAESFLESDTFLDRALVLRGYARLGMGGEAATAAARLAGSLSRSLGREPYLHSPPAAPLAAALLRATQAVDSAAPTDALREVQTLLDRDDVRRQRVPCARCGRGTVGASGVG